MAGKVDFRLIGDSRDGLNTQYIGSRNDTAISNYNAHQNTYFNIDVQQSAYFTMCIAGFEYGRFHSSHYSRTTSALDGRRDSYFTSTGDVGTTGFDSFSRNGSEYWIPLKSIQYSQGSIENMSIAVGTFADLQLPFRKHCPSMTVEMYDHRSDFFEMKLKEWHTQSVVPSGFVPVLESITRTVTLRGYATNGEVNYVQQCKCILADDISTSHTYDANDLKVISFKLIVVGY